MRRNYSTFGFRRFGYRKRYGNRRNWNIRKRRRYPLYRSMRSSSNKSLIRMGYSTDFVVWPTPTSAREQRFYAVIDWAKLRLSLDFPQYQQLYSTFIPVYYKVRWIPGIQSNASGYYIRANIGGDVPINEQVIAYTLTDGFSTTRYDNVDNPLTNIGGTQYTSFKTFDPSKRWRTIVYPRRSQMTAPRQQFDSFDPAPAINETIRGMGRLWIQGVVSWSDNNNNAASDPPVLNPTEGIQNLRMAQLGNLFIFFYMRVYDRK